IPAAVATQYGLTGPILRASGVDWDLRRDRPYSIYPELKSFASVTAVEGDAYARYKVRLAEMRRSIEIVRECIANLPGGAVRARPAQRHEAHDEPSPAGPDRHAQVPLREARAAGAQPRPHRAAPGAGDEHLQVRVVSHVREGLPAARDLDLVHVPQRVPQAA